MGERGELQAGIKKVRKENEIKGEKNLPVYLIRIDYLFRQCVYCNIVFNYVSK